MKIKIKRQYKRAKKNIKLKELQDKIDNKDTEKENNG